MRYEDILEKAKSTMQSCNVCPVCNGIACAGRVPGPGGKGSGSTAVRNYSWWRDHVKIHLDVVKEPFDPDTSTKIFGMELTMPVMAAPIGMVGPNFSHSMDEYTYAHAVAAGAAEAGTIAFTGGGPTDDCFFDPLKAVNELGVAAIPTLKPWKLELVAKRMKSVGESSAAAVAMDIDSAGLPHSSTSIEPVMAKSPSDIRRIKEMTKLPFIVKGVMTAQSAEAVADAGADAIVVSNHGGRVLDEGLATGEVLAEIKKAVGNRTKILVDGGIRTGADVYKALALGADAVLVGRPVAIAAFGDREKGVKMFFEKIRSELKDVMKMTGAQNITNITGNTIKLV